MLSSSRAVTVTDSPIHSSRKMLKRDFESVESSNAVDSQEHKITRRISRADAPRRPSETLRHQAALLLHAPKQRYTHVKKHDVPEIKDEREMLVKIQVVGLNPIDWKAPYVSPVQLHNYMLIITGILDLVYQPCLA